MNPLEALAALHDKFPMLEPGHVWLAGAGPGDPGLLTLDALAGLAQADVIVHDALVDARVLALADPKAQLEFAGKRGGRPSVQQADITARLIELARERKRVLRLKGGDPCMFGRGGEEAIALADAGIALSPHSRHHRGPCGARRGVDPGHHARRQPGRHLRHRPCRCRLRLGGARAHRPADRDLHGDAQRRADRAGR